MRIKDCWFPYVFIVILSFLPCFLCLNGDDFSRTKNPATLPLVTQLMYGKLTNLTQFLSNDLRQNMGYCIKNV